MRATIIGLAILLGFGALPARAADAGGEFVVSSSPLSTNDRFDAAMDARGEALVVWNDDFVVEGRRFGRDGDPLGEDFQVGDFYQNYLGPLAGALDPQGFSVVWSDFGNHSPGQGFFRRFDPAGQPLRQEFNFGSGIGASSVDTDRRGNSVAVAVDPAVGVVGWRFDATGRRIGRRFRIAERGFLPQVTVDARGRFAILWSDDDGVFVRRFDAAANPAGPVLQVAARGRDPQLAGNDDGTFVAVWRSETKILARVYTPSGPRRTATVISNPGLAADSVAMDAAGRFLVTWSRSCCGQPATQIFGRFFEASGQPLDRPFLVSLRTGDRDGQSATAAGPANRFLAVWKRLYPEGGVDLIGRYLTWARDGDDLCRLGAAGLACDVAHDGTAGLVTPALPGPVDQPFLADLDGDRRDDLCYFSSGAGRFRCDTGHDGGAAEVDIAFGTGGVPLLGDLDGDGRDDPCSRQGGQIFCDTAHNGGTAEVVVNFGDGVSRVVLLNEDGDRDDDVCLLSPDGLLLCDTGDDGGAAEVRIPYRVQSGDIALFGDVDDDGRDDPCVARGGRLLCDADHNGGFEASYPFSPRAGELPLLGDVNGI